MDIQVSLHECPFFRGGAGKELCLSQTRVVPKNLGACTENACSSPWRLCRVCVLQGFTDVVAGGVVKPSVGLCRFHLNSGENAQRDRAPLRKNIPFIPARSTDPVGDDTDQKEAEEDPEKENPPEDSGEEEKSISHQLPDWWRGNKHPTRTQEILAVFKMAGLLNNQGLSKDDLFSRVCETFPGLTVGYNKVPFTAALSVANKGGYVKILSRGVHSMTAEGDEFISGFLDRDSQSRVP